jgi:hypothetical protein
LQESQADLERAEAIVETIEEERPGKLNGPPPATVARRAKSYSDFYTVVRAHLKKEKALEKKKSREDLGTELEFAQWYGGVNDELLEASHEEYRCVSKLDGRGYIVTTATGSTRTNCT